MMGNNNRIMENVWANGAGVEEGARDSTWRWEADKEFPMRI